MSREAMRDEFERTNARDHRRQPPKGNNYIDPMAQADWESFQKGWTQSRTAPVYAAYDLMTRQFYHDDGGDSSDSQRLLMVSTDLNALRDTVNARYADPDQVRFHYGTTLAIPANEMRSNRWAGSGGGCMASGHIEIREYPQLEFVK